MAINPERPLLCSVVIPVYNEENNVIPLTERLIHALQSVPGCAYEIIFALDPSTDRTEDIIHSLRTGDPRIKLIRFSRRFGQPAATLGGLRHAGGDVCVIIDADLQDPPELIPKLIEKWQTDGAEVVYAQRRTRQGETLPKRIISYLGYWVINRVANVHIPRNTGDFRLLSRRVVIHLLNLRESHGFLRGLVALVGFKQSSVLYDRDKRVAGKGHYNRWTGSFLIGMNGLFGFSRFPLTAISFLGFMTSGISFLTGLLYLILRLMHLEIPWGNPTLVILITFLAGMQLLSIGILGQYLGRVYDEVRQRPLYIVESAYGFDKQPCPQPLEPAELTVPCHENSPL
jgi:glycosyltransferase involved in cell wall biosynthesis